MSIADLNSRAGFFLSFLGDFVADAQRRASDGLNLDFHSGDTFYDLAVGGSADDQIDGSSAINFSWGLGGADRLGGGEEDDVLHGDAGADLISGNLGADEVEGGPGNDALYGGLGADTVRGGPGNDYLDEGEGHSTVDGEGGDDTLVGGGGPDAFMVGRTSGDDVIKDFTAGPGMFDHLAIMDGLRWEDLSFADTADGVRISWEGGSVLLEGVARSELAQDDFMFADSPDLPPGLRDPAGPTAERATPSVAGPEISGNEESGRLFDFLADTLFSNQRLSLDFDEYAVTRGTDRADEVTGTEMSDTVSGLGGDDSVSALGGDDHIQGDDGNDTLDGGDGRDRVVGGGGDDRLLGGAESDELMGGDGDDYLDEGAAHGMLEGGMGDDTLVGGAGADAFMVSPDSGNDEVLDFVATGDAQGAFDHIAFMGIRADDVSVQDTDRGALVSWDVDGEVGSDGSILLVDVPLSNLRQSDFMFEDAPQFVAGVSDFGSWYIFPDSSGPIA
ncbi:Hemolysin, chromosomal [Roseomonas sp. TAS13]|uniref:Ca2+-binding protein, RTX toxin-related n=3 Tax=Roseomonadaceae TaxID=3385906 RepID=A0A1M6S6F8_9PROT|nr:calcium-binding protein [Roseomonas rosea]PHK92992.1 calcium-binding protein [Pseudoroseomonas rhizosphaerae]PZR08531.1 MAG: calcium-binding protein [Azospirillum brasilense]GAV36261.1 Hemolysin, chromosomal [Roseomonas sp. TAS13]SHK40087.1 Ca2+-binding protein, RTX toxin-related [Roseomonas rosea]